jgi:MFS family permease
MGKTTARSKEAIKWEFSHWRVLFVLYFAYFSNIMSRTAVQVAIPVLQADSAIGFTHAMTASLLSVGAAVQVAGKVLGGAIMVKVGSARYFTLNLAIQVASYLLMVAPIGGTFWFPRYLCGWSASMWAASTMFPSAFDVLGDVFVGNGLGRAVGILSTSSRVGAILGNLVWGPLSGRIKWQFLFLGAAAQVAVACAALKFLLYPLPASQSAKRASEGQRVEETSSAKTSIESAVPYTKAMRMFVRNPTIWCVYFSQTTLTLAMECQALLPLYLRQGAKLSAAQAGSMAAVFPLGAASATLA